MHATIRRYEGLVNTTEGLDQVARQFAATLSGVDGFVSFLVLETEPGVIATISIFEDHVSLKEADRLLKASLQERMNVLLAKPSQVITGEIVFQRGL